MWIKSLDSDVWVNITHITHFTIQYSYDPGNRKLHDVVAFLKRKRCRLRSETTRSR